MGIFHDKLDVNAHHKIMQALIRGRKYAAGLAVASVEEDIAREAAEPASPS